MNRQSGFTLVELMIAGFIGIFILTGLMNLYITTNKNVSLSDSLSQNQEAGRFAMEYLTKYIRKAGYNDEINTPFLPPLYLFPGTTVNPMSCIDPLNKSASTRPNPCAANNPDPITVLGDQLSIPIDVGGDTGDEITSCTGIEVGGLADPANANTGAKKIVIVFWVSDDRELRCQTFNRETNNWIDNSPVSIINNIERLEFQVGVAAKIDDKSASQYINIDTVTASTINLTRIRSFRIAILTTSQDELDNQVRSNVRERTYNVLDAAAFTIEDSNIRNIFINTIELPNMIETAEN